MTKYYCSEHIPSGIHIGWLSTGILTGNCYQKLIDPHQKTTPNKSCNGVFDVSGREYYQGFMRSFDRPNFIGVEPSGDIVAFNVYTEKLGRVECRGVPTCTTTTGKAVLLNRPSGTHGFPYQHTGTQEIVCACCGSNISTISGRIIGI